jgi:hypothetical protein
LSLSSISKHRGADISSRLIPPKPGAIFLIVLIISSASCVSSTIGKALTPANFLNKAHFHSITGRLASGPIFHNPRTAEPSEITATVFPLRVYTLARFLLLNISIQGSATPGEYTVERSSVFVMSTFSFVSIFH